MREDELPKVDAEINNCSNPISAKVAFKLKTTHEKNEPSCLNYPFIIPISPLITSSTPRVEAATQQATIGWVEVQKLKKVGTCWDENFLGFSKFASLVREK